MDDKLFFFSFHYFVVVMLNVRKNVPYVIYGLLEANSEDPNQPAHSNNLIRAFSSRM